MKTVFSTSFRLLSLSLRNFVVCLVLLVLTSQLTFGQSLNYSTTVNSTSGSNYSVTVSLELTAIVPVQNTCQWGYNYDVAYQYDIQIIGSSASLYTLSGQLTCGSNQGIYFDLSNNGGSGAGVTQGNPWTNNTDCATATLQSMQCASIDLQIEGPGIPLQTITLTPTSGNNGGGGQDWCMNGNIADTSSFMGTVNTNPLNFRTNNEERMRITPDGNIGIGVANPTEKLQINGNVGLTGDVIFSSYADFNDTIGKFLWVDPSGKTQPKNFAELQQVMYFSKYCDLNDPNYVVNNPTWANGPNKIYIECPQVNVGIGLNNPAFPLEVVGKTKTSLLQVGSNTIETALITGYRPGVSNAKLLSLGQKNQAGEFIAMTVESFGKLSLFNAQENGQMLQLRNEI